MNDIRLPMINKVLIVGALASDPRLNETKNKTFVVNFRIASKKRFKTKGEKREETCFVNVVAWAGLAEACNKYLQKGDFVHIEGELHNANWENPEGEKRTRVEILAQRIQFLSRHDNVILEDDVHEDIQNNNQDN